MTQMSVWSGADDTDWAWAQGSIWLALLISLRQQSVVTDSEMIQSVRVEKQHPAVQRHPGFCRLISSCANLLLQNDKKWFWRRGRWCLRCSFSLRRGSCRRIQASVWTNVHGLPRIWTLLIRLNPSLSVGRACPRANALFTSSSTKQFVWFGILSSV